MAMTQKDKEDIGQIVETKITREIGSLRLEMNQRFDQTDQKIESVRIELKEEIQQIKQMETEDIQAISADVMVLKKKVALSH